jgi:hypothetical protein
LKDRLADPCSPPFQGQTKNNRKDAKDKQARIRLTVKGQAQSHIKYGFRNGEFL